ncbi:MAG: hypothetical protein FJ265_15715 [Planctomycetes bacterium]|nr:hypothetical protein [Planctomycetota bacterium]
MHPRQPTALVLLLAAALCPAQTDWRQELLLPPVRYPAFTFDPVRGFALAFGGDTDRGLSGETWLWNRVEWQRAVTANRPAARQQSALVFDHARSVSLLFGGTDAAGARLQDTWRFDGVDWTQLQPASAPPARSLHAMVFDAARSTVLLFGGVGAPFGELGDTWEWNGANWVQRTSLHAPPPRSGAAMACDLVRQRVVLFGGSCFQYGPCWRGDTWEWDGVDWIDRTQPWPVPAPPPRWSHGMAYDAATARTLVLGGSDDPGHYHYDLWAWDGTNWSWLQPAQQPPPRLGHGFAFDPGTQRVLAFGGETWFNLLGDLWSFAGGTWQLLDPGMSPPLQILERTEAMASDGDGVLWCGGDVTVYGMQTWRWDGGRWRYLPSAAGPRSPEHHRLQWLPPAGRIVLHQPFRSTLQPEQTLGFDGQTWIPFAPLHQPGVQSGADLALDPRFDRLVLFGGRDASGLRGSTWTFDGADWQLLAVAGPSPREDHAMALDVAGGRVILFGGRNAAGDLGDTHAFDGQQWQLLQPARAPSPRRDHAMAYDLGRQRIVLHGGRVLGGVVDDTWEWTGSDWEQRLTPVQRPGFAHALAYDPRSERLLGIGGFVRGTWSYGAAAPGTIATFGGACGGSLGTPATWTPFGQRPYTGGAFTAGFVNLPGPLALAAVGLSATSWGGTPLPYNLGPFGFPNCDLRVEPTAVSWLAPAGGAAAWTLQVPGAPALVGVQLFVQALALDPNGPAGLAATPGVRLQIGGR